MTADRLFPRELKPEEAHVECNPEGLGFKTTAGLAPLDEIMGQPRALKALDLGLGIRHPTYNIYVAGLSGTGKKETIRRVLNERVGDGATPPDWVYVHNFDAADRPLAISLDPGQGVTFQQDMNALIQHLQEDLPKAFRREDFSRERQRIGRAYEKRGEEAFKELEALAKEKGVAVQQLSNGQIGMVPLKGEDPMSREEFEALSQQEKDAINQRQREVAEQVDALMNRGQEWKRELGVDVRNVERDFARRLIEPRIQEIRQRYSQEKLDAWLDRVRDHMLDHLSRFRRSEDGQEQQLAQMLGMAAPAREQAFTEYRVNPVVDNTKLDHAPVIIEESPNYKNLFGTTGGTVDRLGRLTGDFTQIRAGSLLRANGGYLVLNLLEALIEPLVWKELKRSIKSGTMEFHAYDPLGIFTAAALRPEPIPLNLKLVVLGSPLVYHLLQLYDDDFGEIFKVKADFAIDMDQQEDTGRSLARFAEKIARQEDLPSFTASGVAELVRTATRLAGHQGKVTAEFSRLADLIREAGYWAKQEQADTVDGNHVRRATEEKVYRSNLIAAKIRELIAEGTLLISLRGEAVGQVNGLAVINLGDYAFGKPSRLTASVGIGAAGVINIERESKLSGQTFDKAMLILEGYLRNTYAQAHSLSLSAGLAMEQSYGMIEGDSASVAELACLLSSIAGVPLRQDIGVTGSVNQWGDVQAVGGVNEKIEGFFDICREQGLTGDQGVAIPAANVRHLVLRPEVINAMRDGRFHVWAISHVDDALTLLTGMPAGEPEKEDTFHYAVDQRLRAMAVALKEHTGSQAERPTVSVASSPPPQRDPRPPLPGRDQDMADSARDESRQNSKNVDGIY